MRSFIRTLGVLFAFAIMGMISAQPALARSQCSITMPRPR